MSKKLSLLTEYFNWILRKYLDLQNQTPSRQDAFRIVDIKHKKSGEWIIQVQVIGKASYFTCTPHEIVTNDQLLEGFSKKDIRTITYYASQECKKQNYKILIQEFCEKLNKVVFKIGMRGQAEPIEKTAEQISLDKDLINKLDSEDAHLVGYTTASEMLSKEKMEMERLKQDHINYNSSK